MSRSLVVAFLSLFSLVAASGCRPKSLTPEQMDVLVRDIQPHVKVLSREISLFHYTKRANVVGTDAAPNPFDSRLRWYVSALSDRFFDSSPNCEPCIMGKGLYTATDPVESHSYGGDDWGMVRISLPAGARIIDAEGFQLSDDIKGKLDDWGCGTYYYGTLAALFESEDDPFCRGIIQYAMRKLQVDAVTYNYGAEVFDACRGTRQVALLLISSAHVDWGKTEILTKQIPQDDPASADRAMINAVSARILGGFDHSYWPSLQQVAPADSAVTSWVQDELFSCGNHAEDRP